MSVPGKLDVVCSECHADLVGTWAGPGSAVLVGMRVRSWGHELPLWSSSLSLVKMGSPTLRNASPALVTAPDADGSSLAASLGPDREPQSLGGTSAPFPSSF